MNKLTSSALVLLALILFSLVSCKEDGPQADSKPVANFYVAGSREVNGGPRAVVWINGIPKDQGEASGFNYCTSIALVGTDLYSAVNEFGSTYSSSIYKNGVKFLSVLSDKSEECKINHIAIYNNIVYSCGYVTIQDVKYARIWKGSEEYFSRNSNSEAIRVIPAEGVLYSVINEESGSGEDIVRIFKEKEELYSLSSSPNEMSATDAVYYKGSIYTVGNVELSDAKDKITLWRDGDVFYTINETSVDCVAKSLFIHNGDTYIGGYSSESSLQINARIWQNSKPLYTLNGGADKAEVASLFWWNGFIYSSGYTENQNIFIPIIWCNDYILYKQLVTGDLFDVGQMLVQ
ncbi:MAG: hypothetical protein RR293_07385 [Bacteroidales bacterium]